MSSNPPCSSSSASLGNSFSLEANTFLPESVSSRISLPSESSTSAGSQAESRSSTQTLEPWSRFMALVTTKCKRKSKIKTLGAEIHAAKGDRARETREVKMSCSRSKKSGGC
ncbi:hypothetical protein V8G54_036095 [Vigna mungo]|uniref:Uncharacterized protein n=1 Tax=Vigna mungo TaxID=3915 RepID=A0AAQ3RE05_VIGMU